VQVDLRIDEIVLRALEDKPELRFASMEEFRTQLVSAKQDHPSTQANLGQIAKWAALFILVVLALTVALVALTRDPDAKRPKVLSTNPRNGDRNVDPGLKELRVVFSRSMLPGRMSIVGDGPEYPNFEGEPRWEDERVFIYAWELEPEHDYWISFNSDRFTNFRGTNYEPSVPSPLSFRTGKARMEERAATPAPR